MSTIYSYIVLILCLATASYCEDLDESDESRSVVSYGYQLLTQSSSEELRQLNDKPVVLLLGDNVVTGDIASFLRAQEDGIPLQDIALELRSDLPRQPRTWQNVLTVMNYFFSNMMRLPLVIFGMVPPTNSTTAIILPNLARAIPEGMTAVPVAPLPETVYDDIVRMKETLKTSQEGVNLNIQLHE